MLRDFLLFELPTPISEVILTLFSKKSVANSIVVFLYPTEIYLVLLSVKQTAIFYKFLLMKLSATVVL